MKTFIPVDERSFYMYVSDARGSLNDFYIKIILYDNRINLLKYQLRDMKLRKVWNKTDYT